MDDWIDNLKVGDVVIESIDDDLNDLKYASLQQVTDVFNSSIKVSNGVEYLKIDGCLKFQWPAGQYFLIAVTSDRLETLINNQEFAARQKKGLLVSLKILKLLESLRE